MIPEPTSAQILVLVRDPDLHRQLVVALDEQCQLITSIPEASDDAALDLVVTDDPTAIGSLGVEHDVGVIAVGAARGDLSLPADAGPREWRLACRLLMEIVRLRRSNRTAHDVQHQLKQLAAYDELTGLANRRAWETELQQRLAAAATRSDGLCCALVDLDLFKAVNDAFGHAAGDEVLRQTAHALQASVREDDFAARLGGDEFGLLFCGSDAAQAGEICERVRCRFADRLAQTAPHAVTASVGYCWVHGPTLPTAEALYAAASHALLVAKRSGRNQTASSTHS